MLRFLAPKRVEISKHIIILRKHEEKLVEKYNDKIGNQRASLKKTITQINLLPLLSAIVKRNCKNNFTAFSQFFKRKLPLTHKAPKYS